MKRHLSFYVLAAAVVLVGAVAFGVPTSSLWLGFVVLCPLMMIFMMGGMHGGDGQGGGQGGQGSVDFTNDRHRKSRLDH